MERLDARLKELPSAGYHELVVRISVIDEFKGWWRGRCHAFPSVLRRLKKRTIPLSADASARIGGRTEYPPPGKPPWGRGRSGADRGGHAERSGYAELLRSVFDESRTMEFGQDLILRFHTQLFRHAAADRAHRGKYRAVLENPPSYLRGGTESLVLRPLDPHLIPGEMKILTDWTVARLASSDFHPLLVIASFLLEFLAIRPFTDGNGRMSRILANLLLLKSGYEHVPYLSMDKIIADRGAEYQIALRRAQAKRNYPRPDITPWLRAFLEALQAQASELRTLLEGRPREDLLSENQRAVLSLLDRYREVTIRQVRSELAIPRDTAKQVLGRLYDRNLVLRTGAGRATRYRRSPLSPG